MEIIIKAIIMHKKPEIMSIRVNELNWKKIFLKLEFEKRKIINQLKRYEKQGLIKSIFIPKNKKIQSKLNQLIECKRIITKSLQQIDSVFN
jgi:hypothetical protein